MILSSAYRKCRLALCALGLLAAVTGCVSRGALSAGDGTSADTFRMSVTVITNAGVSTRAGHADDTQQAGSEAENYIDFPGNDFRIVLFDKAGNYLYEVDGQGRWDSYSVSNDRRVYTLDYEIDFPETIGRDKRAEIRAEGLQVLVLGNWRSSGASYGTFAGRTLGGENDIWRDGTNYNFNYRPADGNETWRPDPEENTLIPMFGYAKSTPFNLALGGGTIGATAKIPMQRALAKVEVIDNLVNQPALSVGDVTMTAFNTSGRFIPDVTANANWDKVGEQVDVSSLPDRVTAGANLKFFHDVDNKKWIAYVPEMALTQPALDAKKSFDPAAAGTRPHLEVKIVTDNSLSFYEGGTYPVHFASYDANSVPTIPDDSWNHILRNHIYRFSVNKVGVSVQLHLHVRPWQEDEVEEWDFTDHVTVSKTLEWAENTYEANEEEDRNVILLLEDGVSLKGEFQLMSPVNGRWYARLVPLGDAKPNAVTFVDANGDVMEPSDGGVCLEISGQVDKDRREVIYIRPTELGNDYESRFRLEFLVENLGVWMEVPVTKDGSSNYTIVRKRNIIE